MEGLREVRGAGWRARGAPAQGAGVKSSQWRGVWTEAAGFGWSPVVKREVRSEGVEARPGAHTGGQALKTQGGKRKELTI